MEKLLYKIVKMTQGQLHEYLYGYLKDKNYEVISDHKYLYAEGNIPFLLVAHLDTVHTFVPTDIFFDAEQKVLWSPQGIGGDDRAGVYGILKVLEHCKPHVLFLHDEEIGGVGARIASYELENIPPVNFMIEFDRQGSDDAVFYDCGNVEFQKHICDFGFKLNYGSFSDISVLSPMWDIASVNLSIGYYNQHSSREFIRLNELDATVEKTIKILTESDPNVFYDYQEVYYPPITYRPANNNTDEQLDDGQEIITLEEFYEIFGRGYGSEILSDLEEEL